MAKMFYSLEEAQEKLACSAERIKQLVGDGKLREFRDGAKIMFKVDEVENLDLAGPDVDDGEIGLAPSDSAAPAWTGQNTPGDSSAPADQPLSDADLAGEIDLAGDTGSSIGLVPGDSADRIGLDDTGEPNGKDDTVVTTHGVNVFDESDADLAEVDPMAQTQMAPDISDQVHLDSGSSGSGLLDLTREADDTSLGAELLEEIYPGSEEGDLETQMPTQLDMRPDAESAAAMDAQAAPLPVLGGAGSAIDPISGAFGVMMIIPMLMLIYLACITAAGMAGVQPALFEPLKAYNWYVIGAAALLAGLLVLIGTVAASRPAHAASPKPKRIARVKKGKKSKKGAKDDDTATTS